MIISIASGKGGTGKTTVAVNLALSLDNVQFLDCDVEEPNAHLFLKPQIQKKISSFIPVPEVDEEKCTACGRCREVCAYNALAVFPGNKEKKGNVLVFHALCHGCGACMALCPEKAIKEVNREIGVIETGMAEEISFIHGKLNIGEPMAPPLIRQVKAHADKNKTVIIDAPPGTSCPVVTSLKGSNYCILVTEPTPFGLNDLVLAVEVVRKLKIPFGIVINRSDIGDNKTEKYCKKEKIPVLMRIPFKREIASAYSKGITIVEALPEWNQAFQDLFKKINNTGNIIEDTESVSLQREALMKQILVISGKGGTGKTVVTGAFASLAKNKVMADCDVDAADLHLLLHPSVKEKNIFQSGQTAVIDKELCVSCGKCLEACRFKAISQDYVIDGIDCEGCGFCSHICPANAIRMEDNVSGNWFISDTDYGTLVHAKLGIAEENSGKLVSLVRKQAEKLAKEQGSEYVIVDGPPGTGCPVIASLSGIDLAVIVTEPTLSGMHDMKRVLDLTKHFQIKACVIINKFDLNQENAEAIESHCLERDVSVIGRVPFSPEVSRSVVEGKPLVEFSSGDSAQAVSSAWEKIEACL